MRSEGRAPYDPAQLYAHPKRWGEQPTHPMNSGLHVDIERNRLRVLEMRKEKQAMLQPDKLQVSQRETATLRNHAVYANLSQHERRDFCHDHQYFDSVNEYCACISSQPPRNHAKVFHVFEKKNR